MNKIFADVILPRNRNQHQVIGPSVEPTPNSEGDTLPIIITVSAIVVIVVVVVSIIIAKTISNKNGKKRS